MFSDMVLEEILKDKRILEIPLEYRSIIFHKIFDVLDEKNLLKEGAKDGI